MGEVRLHIGAGKRNFGELWDHIDAQKLPHIKSHDVTKLPYESNSVSLIYSAHLIAYFDRQEIGPVLKEWHRVLKPGGVLRLATPDMEALTRLVCQDHDRWYDLSKILGPLYGRMDIGEKVIYHKTVYNASHLYYKLEAAGFKGVKRYDHAKTEHACFDDHSMAYIDGTLISLNVEAHK